MKSLPFTFKEEIKYRLLDKPMLTPIFKHVLDVPERLFEYDPSFFIVFNNEMNRHEVHSLDNKGDTYCFAIPYKRLDARTLRKVWQDDLRVHGSTIFEELEKEEEQREKAQERKRRNEIEAFAKETKSLFAKDAWLM
jgi:hypothetical protein